MAATNSNSNFVYPNLPGLVPNKDSWVFKQKEGFNKTIRPKSALNSSSSTVQFPNSNNELEVSQVDVGVPLFRNANPSSNIGLNTYTLGQISPKGGQDIQFYDANPLAKANATTRPGTAGHARANPAVNKSPSQLNFHLLDNSSSNNNLTRVDSANINSRPSTAGPLGRKEKMKVPGGEGIMFPASPFAVTEIGFGNEIFKNNNDSILRRDMSVPKFVERDKQVCRFYAFFTEARTWDQDSPLGTPTIEREAIRELTIFFYITDNTIEITENIKRNSGMTGGNFFKRAPIKKNNGRPLQLSDIRPGETLSIVGRTLNVIGCDPWTRNFFHNELRIDLNPDTAFPEAIRWDMGTAYSTGFINHMPPVKKDFGTRSTDYAEQREKFNKTLNFLNFDGRVLRFLMCDATALPGYRPGVTFISSMLAHNSDMYNSSDVVVLDSVSNSAKKFALSYFLADNQIDIRIVKPHEEEKKGGKGATSKTEENVLVMKKNKIAKNWKHVRRGDAPDYYQPMDFICGTTIDIYGKLYFVYSCDHFTRSAYEEMGIDQADIPVYLEPAKSIKHEIPQLGDGFLPIGSQEDTLATVYGHSKPGKDLMKIKRNQNRTIRCTARILSDDPIYSTRNFMITFYLEDDTIQIYEEIRRNTGIGGGNFLKRGRYLNNLPPDSNEPRDFLATDIYLGNVISINGTDFKINSMDNLSLKFCETCPEEFPLFDTFGIIKRLVGIPVVQRINFRKEFSRVDQSLNQKRNNFVDKAMFLKVFDSLGVLKHLSDQERLTLSRRFEENGKFYYHELCDLISHVVSIKNNSSVSSALKKSTSSTFDDLGIFMLSSRQKETQWRRVIRKDNETVSGLLSLDNLVRLFKKHGFIVSEECRQAIGSLYRVKGIDGNTSKELDRRSAVSNYNEVSIRKIASGKADIRSELRKVASISKNDVDPREETITERRQRLLGNEESGAQQNAISGSSGYNANIIIDGDAFCDAIYAFDWL